MCVQFHQFGFRHIIFNLHIKTANIVVHNLLTADRGIHATANVISVNHCKEASFYSTHSNYVFIHIFVSESLN